MFKFSGKNSSINTLKSSTVHAKRMVFPILFLECIVNHYSDRVYFLLLIDNFDDFNLRIVILF